MAFMPLIAAGITAAASLASSAQAAAAQKKAGDDAKSQQQSTMMSETAGQGADIAHSMYGQQSDAISGMLQKLK